MLSTAQLPGFSWLVFVSLLAILAAAAGMFVVLSRRWTSTRLVVELERWGRENGFRVRGVGGEWWAWIREKFPPAEAGPPGGIPAPAPFDHVPGIETRWLITSDDTTIAQIQSAIPPVGAEPRPMMRWNILIREMKWNWPTVVLRPAEQPNSIFDLLQLTHLPTTIGQDRFTVLGQGSRGLRRLERVPLVGIIPADIGLMLAGPYLVIEFTSRPFDRIELGRMLALADQLAQLEALHLYDAVTAR